MGELRKNNRSDYRMKFGLKSKFSGEIIDRMDLANIGLNGAKTYFMGRKQLSEEKFDELFEVEVDNEREAFVGRYDWWKEEPKTPDEI